MPLQFCHPEAPHKKLRIPEWYISTLMLDRALDALCAGSRISTANMWSARRRGIVRSARRQGRRYRVRRRAIDIVPFLSPATDMGFRSWSALRIDGLSGIARGCRA